MGQLKSRVGLFNAPLNRTDCALEGPPAREGHSAWFSVPIRLHVQHEARLIELRAAIA